VPHETSAVAKKVFISYRREDTAPAAGRVYDRLCRLLPPGNVFFDVSAIAGGENFEDKIVSEIKQSDVVLVLIGKRWLEPSQPESRARIWADDDYVRAELRVALQGSALLMPILVDGARMPGPQSLPADVKAITARNALPLRHESFDDDTENIVRAIFGVAGKERPWENRSLLVKIGYSAGGAIAALAGLVVVALVHRWALARPISASVGEAMTILLLIAAVILGAWFGLRYEARQRRQRLQS
jgi:hypothetical protein